MSRTRAAQLIAVLALSAAPTLALAQATGGVIAGDVAARTPKARVGVVVHLENVTGTFRPPAKTALMDQKGMTFVPHILAVQKGTTVVFHNSDAVSHNIFTPDGDKYNLGSWGQGKSTPHAFNTVGVFHQLCNVHPEMGAVIVVLDNPYFAVTGADGKFQIEGVPPGTYTLKTWSEKGPETTRQVTVTAAAPTNLHIELGK
jgi:plastocyanin